MVMHLPKLPVSILDIQEIYLPEFINLARRKNFCINKTYQRSKTWKLKQQRSLIRSIMKGYCIGLFTLKDRGDGRWEILDGQQRTNTIFTFVGERLNEDIGFIEKKFDVDGSKYENIRDDDSKRPIWESNKIVYVLLPSTLKDEETANYFVALQEGTPLNAAEKLSARPGDLRNIIASYSDRLPLIKNDNCIRPYRFNRRYLLSQLVTLELNTDWKSKPDFPNYRFDDIKKVYDDYKQVFGVKKKKIEKIFKQIENNLHVLENSVMGNERFLKESGYLIPIYLHVSYLERNYCAFDLKKYGNFVVWFIDKVKSSKGKRGKFGRFNLLVGAGTTKDNITEKFTILKKEFNKKFGKRLKKKDRKRAFLLDQKRRILIKCRRKCFFSEENYCPKTDLTLADAEFHHKIFYSRGGKTNITNGESCHKECHRKFHVITGPDIED